MAKASSHTNCELFLVEYIQFVIYYYLTIIRIYNRIVKQCFYVLQLFVPDDLMVIGTSKGALRDVYFSGFPTFKHLSYAGEIKSIRVKVFDMPSNNVSMVVRLANLPEPLLGLEALRSVAAGLIGREVYVGWPHLGEALVMAVSSRDYEYTKNGSQMSDPRGFEMQLKTISNQ